MPLSPTIYDSFPRIFDDDDLVAVGNLHRELGMRPVSIRPATTEPRETKRLSNLSSISEWSRKTIGCIQSSDFSWFRMEEEGEKMISSRGTDGTDDKSGEHNGGSESTPTPQLTALPMHSNGAMESKEGAIWRLSGEHDPINWGSTKKWMHVIVLSMTCFVASMGSLILSPAAPEVTQRLQIHSELLRPFIVSIFSLGFVTGPLMASLSELHGRLLILHLSNWCLVGFNVACGFSQTEAELFVFRSLAGALGTACFSIGGFIISDIFHPGTRAIALATLEAGRLLGWSIGPIVGSITIRWLNWHWLFWILAAAAGFTALLSMIALRETYVPILLRRRSKRRRGGRRRSSLGVYVNPATAPSTSLRRSVLMPLKMLCLDPLVAITALYSATLSGILILIATTIPFTYSKKYHFSAFETGFVYIAPGIGMITGLLLSGLLIGCTARKQQSNSKPERRISVLSVLVGTIMAGGGVALYGWATKYNFHWIIPLIGLGAFGCGLLPLTTGIQSYLTEAYSSNEACVMAANSIMRSLASGLLPLSGLVIYDRLSFSWGNTVLAGILGVSIFIPIICKILGGKIRKRFRVDT